MSAVVPGVCRHCACTEDDACRLGSGDTCGWTDATRTVCTRSGCLIAEAARVARKRAEDKGAAARNEFAGWGLGAIRLELDRRRRNRRRGKRKAA